LAETGERRQATLAAAVVYVLRV